MLYVIFVLSMYANNINDLSTELYENMVIDYGAWELISTFQFYDKRSYYIIINYIGSNKNSTIYNVYSMEDCIAET